jgi:hypothetical protein
VKEEYILMKTASVSDIKKELKTLPPIELLELCMRVTKYKKENKELLNYLLFEAHDEERYIENVKKIMETEIGEMNSRNLYLAKKTLRKVLRTANKHIKYSKIDKTEIELRIYFCQLIKKTGLKIQDSTTLSNMYLGQVAKIKKTFEKLHEDLQYDYIEEIKTL